MEIREEYSPYITKQLITVVQADYIGDFAIRVFFSDGHQKLVDFKPFLASAKHPSFERYLDESLFKQFDIKDGNLDWHDYALCFPVDDLYHNAILKDQTTQDL